MPPKRRRRLLRWFALSIGALLLLVLLTPYALSLGFLRATVRGQVSSNLRGECEIEDVSFSWFSGVEARGLRIKNPPGFPQERPAIVIDEMFADFSLLSLLSGSVSAHAEIYGLEVHVEQQADGTTNLQALAPEPEPGQQQPAPEPGEQSDTPPDEIEFDFRLHDASITIRREGQLLEALTDLNLRAHSAAAKNTIDIEADGKLTAGELDVRAMFDPNTQATDARVTTKGLDLGNWQPLIDSVMADQITAIAGKVDGELTAKMNPGEPMQVGGDLVVAEPRLAGPIVQGMDLRAKQWRLQPDLAVDSESPSNLDASKFQLDFEWLQLNGANANKPGEIAFGYQIDVARLADFGGPIPAMLKDSGSRVAGTVQLPMEQMPADLDGWIQALAATAKLQVDALDVAGFALRNVGIDASVKGGSLSLATTESTLLDDGSLVASFEVDLKQLDKLPTSAALKWNGGKLTGGAAQGLQYVMPLLAGFTESNTEVSGGIDLQLKFSGPAMKAGEQDWVTWLDQWRGDGSLGMLNTSFAPSKGLRGLLEPLGPLSKQDQISKNGQLKVDSFSAPFSFENGTVEAKSSKWLAGGESIGLTGKASFDGNIDYALDLSGLLKSHKDGAKVLAALGGTLNAAHLTGTLDAPKLELPKLDDIAAKLIQNQGKDLLRKGLKSLFKK